MGTGGSKTVENDAVKQKPVSKEDAWKPLHSAARWEKVSYYYCIQPAHSLVVCIHSHQMTTLIVSADPGASSPA